MKASGPDQVCQPGPVLPGTIRLLTPNVTVRLALSAMRTGRLWGRRLWLLATLVLGTGFVTSEIHASTSMVSQDLNRHQRAFLSAFYMLVVTHRAHVTFGFFWTVTFLV